jgi:hypothetical protein
MIHHASVPTFKVVLRPEGFNKRKINTIREFQKSEYSEKIHPPAGVRPGPAPGAGRKTAFFCGKAV